MEARIATYGGIITYLSAPDRDGRYEDIVLGDDSLAGYLEHPRLCYAPWDITITPLDTSGIVTSEGERTRAS